MIFRRQMAGVALFIWLTLAIPNLTPARGAGTLPQVCQEPHPERAGKFELGILYQTVIPSGLVGFDKTIPAYGPVVGFPLWGHTFQVAGLYGSQAGLNVYLLETSMRFGISMPYFNGFVLAGAHYLRYSQDVTVQGAAGANAGLGLALALGSGFEVHLGLRAYIQRRTMIAMGGGFSFLL